MKPLIHLAKKNKKTFDYIVHYFDVNDVPQVVSVRVDPAWCSKKAMTLFEGIQHHLETKLFNFKRVMMDWEDV